MEIRVAHKYAGCEHIQNQESVNPNERKKRAKRSEELSVMRFKVDRFVSRNRVIGLNAIIPKASVVSW